MEEIPKVEGCGSICRGGYWYWGRTDDEDTGPKRWIFHKYPGTICGQKNGFNVSWLCDDCARPLGLVW